MSILERFRRMPDHGVDPARAVRIRPGTIADYELLAPFHYRAGRPATIRHILAAVSSESPDHPAPAKESTVAVLVVSNPTLEGRWRHLAWPGEFRSGRKAKDARRLNEMLRTISRVIVEPRWRGLGLATRLVRTYLQHPLTPYTDAAAAMGLCCPFFRAAGMREWALPPTRRDQRLVAAIARAGLEPWQLLEPVFPRAAHAIDARLERCLRRWAADSRTTRELAAADLPRLARAAALAVSCRPVAYTWPNHPGGPTA